MIRTIHPLYSLVLMIILLVILIWQNNMMEKEIASSLSERAQARDMAKRIVALKQVMKSPDMVQLNGFLDGTAFAGSDIKHHTKNGRYIIESKNMDARQIQLFLNRVLNMSVKVVQLKIQSKDEKHVSLYMEIDL